MMFSEAGQVPSFECSGGGPKDMKTLRILIADDHPVVLRGVRSLLETQTGWEVCGEARSGAEAFEQVNLLKPDILIMDISMPGMNGFEAIRKIHEYDARIGILTLTMHDTEPMFRGAMEAGAHGFILKSDLEDRLIEAVQALCENRSFFSPGISRTVMMSFIEGNHGSQPGTRDPSVLTSRQLEVLKLVAKGMSNKEVANALQISRRTAETHRYQIMSRLGVRTLSELVLFAVRNDIISL